MRTLKHIACAVAVLAVVVGCKVAPPIVVDNPGRAFVSIVVDTDPAVTVAALNAATVGTWGVDADNPRRLVTVDATTAQARNTHGAMCSAGGGFAQAVLTEIVFTPSKGKDVAYTKKCTTPTDDVEPLPTVDVIATQTGGVSFYSERGTLAWSEYEGVGFRSAIGCAHKTWAKGTRIRVEWGGRSTVCVVDDRGPYVPGRVIDLQPAQFSDLAPTSRGVLHDATIEAVR